MCVMPLHLPLIFGFSGRIHRGHGLDLSLSTEIFGPPVMQDRAWHGDHQLWLLQYGSQEHPPTVAEDPKSIINHPPTSAYSTVVNLLFRSMLEKGFNNLGLNENVSSAKRKKGSGGKFSRICCGVVDPMEPFSIVS